MDKVVDETGKKAALDYLQGLYPLYHPLVNGWRDMYYGPLGGLGGWGYGGAGVHGIVSREVNDASK